MQSVGQRGDVALPRSAASVYCARSLVPSEKKSTCGTKTRTSSAAAGTSTMMPTSTRSAARTPAAAKDACACVQQVRARSSSSTVATIGNMIRTG